uniref:Non-structural maintenance of chromosomes element 1 homolog n=1 Tax=Caligus rogercresseyi TaxID=217165 RepID=C1BMI7_CALRO|nr:Non-structural maintenance of chromosomes element 1 homolog [Caligus rogercresseyi]
MEYDDRHRIFLQGVLNMGVVSRSAAKNLLQKAYTIRGDSLPTQSSELSLILREITYSINKKIQHLNLAIVKAIDENQINKEGYFVLINQLDRSEELTQLTQKCMIEFAPHGLEFLKLLMDEMIQGPKSNTGDEENEESDDEEDIPYFRKGEIMETRALNLGSRLKSKTLKPLEAQAIIDKFIEKKWLRSSESEEITFTPRFIAEMETYLRSVYPDDISSCSLCNKMVVKSLLCECGKQFHLYCLGAAIPKSKNRDEVMNVPCPKCKASIALRQTSSTQPGSRKRSHNEEDDE